MFRLPLSYLADLPESLSTFYASNDRKGFWTLVLKLRIGLDNTGYFLPNMTQMVFVVNLWNYESPHGWYVRLGIHFVSFAEILSELDS